MVATPLGGGGRGGAGRARPTTRPKAVAAPAMRGSAPPPASPPLAGQTGGARPGAKEPVRPRLVLSKKGLVRAAPSKPPLNPGAGSEPPSAQPIASGAEVRAGQPPGSGMTGVRRRYSVAASREPPEQRRKSLVPATLAAEGKGAGKLLSVTFPWSLDDVRRQSSDTSHDEADRDEDSSSNTPPSEDTATPPAVALGKRPPEVGKPPTEVKRPSVTAEPPAAAAASAPMPAATSKPPEVTAAVTSSGEPKKAAATEEAPVAPPSSPAFSAAPTALATPATLATPAPLAAQAPSTPSVPLVPPVLQVQSPPSASAAKPAVAQKLDAKKTEAAIAPVPKSTWWTALAQPFSVSGATSGAVGPNEEVPVPAHVRRYSMAMTDNQRAQARTNVKLQARTARHR
ncbi:nascent polypeptide-associated complex subunit alpha, muscle-specific form-like [Dermacentor silvarum]|uniref:nascent polypeptide-associated complex subunit alpha, muscle-specific form-like n=1 Tax=Dermacentor silvarum TaxID=543639 RepID=UPI0021006B8E|nr:nascent polypeptide-associated complex subunit alpha, muscle-specific form-like [Dermacentor silvarum]